MRTQPARFLRIILFFAFASLLPLQSFAQTVPAAVRITQAIDESQLTVLRGNTYYLAEPQYDRGPAPASLPMNRMLLLLQRSPEQEAALQQLLAQQQDATSPNFHQWLTPPQFGQQFGPADQDIQTVTSWLQSHGFQVTRVSNGRTVIEFSGTAAQVQEAFHTAIHQYAVPSAHGIENRWANSSDPQIPAALTPVVAGVRSLHNFPATPMNEFAGIFRRDKQSGKIVPAGPLPIPQFTPGSGVGCGLLGGPCELLGPYDLATIYDISPLWNAATPIDGTGQTIAIVGETDINPSDWTAFWNVFGVATPKGTLNIIHDGPDPGIQSDESEADIDTQWSSAIARGATIDFVVSESTEATLGVDLSAEFIVDNNLAPVMSESYGVCELGIGTTGNTYYNALWQQASAQGITVLVSTGDQGSAVCDRGATAAKFGLAVNGFGSTPYNVAVGGTDFNDLTTTSKYWNPTNNTNQANAKGYIPEMTWNDTCTNSEVFSVVGTGTAEQTCNDVSVQQYFLGVEGGSGGASNCTTSNGSLQSSCLGGYPKPVWQNGPGFPSDGSRDVPDVSLFASNGFNNTFYIICQSDASGPCDLNNGDFSGFGGTSVSAPAFAGIIALINQKTGERQGNANYVFYKMAGTSSNSCDSSSVPLTGTNNCIFYDIPSGSTIAMPCISGSPNCKTSTSGDPYGVLTGYSTGTGYDLATGLGSVNVANLVNQWSTYAGKFGATKFGSFTLGPPTTITHGQAMPVAATVLPQSGSGTPTGTISLIANTGASPSNQQGAQQVFPLTSGSLPAGTSTAFLPGGTSYTVTAHYSGDSTFAPADSSPVTVTVNPESSKTQAEIITFNPTTGQTTSTNATSFPYGSLYILRSDVTNSSGTSCAPSGNPQYGCPTGTVTITDTLDGVTSPLDGGTFALNAEGYTEDQPIFLMGGQHSIVASYGGDKSYHASSNSAAPDVVTVTQALTSVSLTSGTNIIQVGAYPNLTTTITTQALLPSNAPVADYPADSLQYFDGSAKLSGQLTYIPSTGPSGTAQVTAYITTNALHVGNNTITAQFLGDPNYLASATSNPVIVDVVIPTSATITTSNATIQHGTPVTFTAQITPQQTGAPAMTGTVQFWINCANCTSIGSATLANGQAQVTTSTLPAGNLTIIATYGGDTNYGSSSAGVSETVNLLGSTTSVSTSNEAISQGTSVTLTAQVAATKSGGPALTGTVQFYSAVSAQGNQTPIGSAVTVASGQTQLVTTAIPSGTQLVVATYSGDSNYATSTASTAEVVTGAPTVTVTASPTTVPISTPGANGSTMITFTGVNGYSGTIPLSPALCTGMPSETSCSFSASSAVLSSTTTAQVIVTFQTTAASSAPPQFVRGPARFDGWKFGEIFALACALLALIFSVLAGTVGRRSWSMACAILAMAALAAMASCGGGGGSGPSNPGTPVGVDPNVIITFSGAGVTPSPTLNLSINVQ